MSYLEEIAGKNVVITGGSKGIGEELVRIAVQSGARVTFTYNTKQKNAERLIRELNSNAKHVQFSLGDQDSTDRFLQFVGSDPIDYFIANAGIVFSGSLAKHTSDKIKSVIDTNVFGNMYLLMNLIYGHGMALGGQISVIGSLAAEGHHDHFVYSASKAALRGAVNSLSRYEALVKEQDLSVKLLEPAFVRTPMGERKLKILERKARKIKGGDQLIKEFRKSGYVMNVDYVAQEILRLTVDSSVTGVRQIPDIANIHETREKFINLIDI